MKIIVGSGFGRAERTLRKAARKAPFQTAEIMFSVGQVIFVPLAKAHLRRNRSIFRGQLHQRLGVRVTTRRGGARAKAGSAAIEFGAFGVPYGLNVEEGSPPHSADLEKLVEYARKKMGYPKTKREKRSRKRRAGPTADAVAVAIWKTIRKEGTKPHPFIVPAFEDGRRPFLDAVVRRLRKEII